MSKIEYRLPGGGVAMVNLCFRCGILQWGWVGYEGVGHEGVGHEGWGMRGWGMSGWGMRGGA